ncbi:DNA polymerase III subunit gamma/tau, partial [Candidatus Saccharibacteria bacterium]|nr:DNA polymerase III subunit gamma/tau [Candidatus Saccharibacteria bacterium]
MGETKKPTRQALYRKYRSKSLNEIIGQTHITKTLANAIKQGKISHAYLFTGPRGTGKTSIARILAHEINGIPYTDDSTHLDIIEIDAASNRRIDDIRDLREKVHIAPLSAKYKVYIIDEVHMLTTESFNALLKTLEEPPEHVVFILATTEVHKLPATIISRTQRHSFKSIPSEQVAEHLSVIAKQEKIAISDEALELLAKHGNGSIRDSISLLDQLSTHDVEVTTEFVESLLGIAPTTQLISLLEAINGGNTASVLELVDKLIQSGLTPSGIANQLAYVVRDEITLGKVNHEMVALLGRLLEVHSATYKQLKLESVLLSATMVHVTEAPKSTPQPVKTSALVVETPKIVANARVVEEKNTSPEK